MRKNKWIATTMAAVAITACSNDAFVADIDGTLKPAHGQALTFNGLIEDEFNTPTRATINMETMNAEWRQGDRVSISNGTANAEYRMLQDGRQTGMEAASGMAFPTDAGGSFCAFYPSQAVSSWSGTTATAMIYTQQQYAENYRPDGTSTAFGGYMAAPVATADGTHVSLQFNLVSSIVDVNLEKLGIDLSTVESVWLRANAGESLAGQMKYNCATRTITLQKASNGYTTSGQSDVIRVAVNGQMAAQAQGTAAYVRFYTLPVQVTAGYTVTVRTTDGTFYTRSTTSAVGGESTLLTMTSADKGRVCHPYYKRLGFGTAAGSRTGCWMATVPGNTYFTMLTLPGAHDAATATVTSSTNQARCQQYTIAEQLAMGVRALDLRPYVRDENTAADNIPIYHGSVNTNVKLHEVLSDITEFLDHNPTETVFLLMHDEKGDNKWNTPVSACLSSVSKYIAAIPTSGNLTLNNAHGRMVIIARDNLAGASALGVGKCGWGSSFGDKTVFRGSDSGSPTVWTLMYQDEYEYASNYATARIANAEKLQTEYIARNETNANRLYVNTLNVAWSLSTILSGASNITKTAPVVNAAFLASPVFQASTGRWGIVNADYIGYAPHNGRALLDMIISQNYRYLYQGHSR